jgi:hypothetical protein
MSDFFEAVGYIVVFIAIIFGLSLVLALPTMWLWNWLMPTIFGLTKITLIQAFGINLLSGILFNHSTGKKKD